jgi:hypothetical protein
MKIDVDGTEAIRSALTKVRADLEAGRITVKEAQSRIKSARSHSRIEPWYNFPIGLTRKPSQRSIESFVRRGLDKDLNRASRGTEVKFHRDLRFADVSGSAETVS